MLTLDSLNAMWVGQRNADSPVRIMGFRNGLLATPPASPNIITGAYDCLFAVILNGSVTFWRGSTNAALYFLANPCNPAGCAQLSPGNHLFGAHMLHGEYLCFEQAENCHIRRLDTKGSIVSMEFAQDGICIHSGGSDPATTGHFSEGCQILFNADGYFRNPTWERFLSPINAAMSQASLANFSYLLQEGLTGLGEGLTLQNAA